MVNFFSFLWRPLQILLNHFEKFKKKKHSLVTFSFHDGCKIKKERKEGQSLEWRRYHPVHNNWVIRKADCLRQSLTLSSLPDITRIFSSKQIHVPFIGWCIEKNIYKKKEFWRMCNKHLKSKVNFFFKHNPTLYFFLDITTSCELVVCALTMSCLFIVQLYWRAHNKSIPCR